MPNVPYTLNWFQGTDILGFFILKILFEILKLTANDINATNMSFFSKKVVEVCGYRSLINWKNQNENIDSFDKQDDKLGRKWFNTLCNV